MSPAICSGDSLIIDPITDNIGLGDIVAYISPETNQLVIHRIVGNKNGYYLLKGDNVWHNDGRCGKDSIYGYVKFVLIVGNKGNFFQKSVRAVFTRNDFLKKTFALASRFNILTFACRVANRIA